MGNSPILVQNPFVLIPKNANPTTTSHFRPLGLCTTQNKIVAKIIVNRLRHHLNNLVSPFQGAFMKGRHTTDLFLLAQECIHFMNNTKRKEEWLILKINIRKVFDSISWNFISQVLKVVNLPEQWIKLINSYLHSMEYIPIINGNKTTPFKPTRGIRQGDHLSPYIFILAIEYLSTQIQEVVSSSTRKPFKLKSHNLQISLLLFADNIVLFAQADNTTIQTINNVLQHFCNSSGMTLNLKKKI